MHNYPCYPFLPGLLKIYILLFWKTFKNKDGKLDIYFAVTIDMQKTKLNNEKLKLPFGVILFFFFLILILYLTGYKTGFSSLKND